MTSDAKRALSRTIRELRKRLIEDLGEATERSYRLSIDAKKASLDEASRVRRARLEGWIDEQVRALPAKSRAAAAERLRGDVIKDAAATLLQRLVYLRLLEASGLRKYKVVTGGWESGGYADFRDAAPELVRAGPGDETEGYATLLALVFDELALDLPGLYGPVRMTSLVPVPASTLRAVIKALDDDELATVWADDTTLGWIYQYWNDPEREALDAKLAASKKLENHEIASKTQMFTERYMVEWLLHNSLGQMWLAMCRKHGWTADFERADAGGSVLDRLEARRADWRAKREAGEVALDALMPIAPGLEDRWKYWVPQPMPDDAVSSAPDSVRTLKLLDPACGSGHFLVIAFELLFHLYQEESRHRGEAGTDVWTDRRIVESILEHNLHGIDIDPRAVQIAAAALMLKAQQLCADAEPRTLNLVAPNLSLASLPETDPARLALYAAVEQETGIPPALTGRIIAALAGADHLGTLLKVDTEIDTAIAAWDSELSQPVADQGGLFDGFAPRRRKRITAEHAKATLLSRLESFLDHHTTGADLGLRLRGEQLAAGVRFVRMVREDRYDLVVGNPPYLGTSKLQQSDWYTSAFPMAKADVFAGFMLRSLSLVREAGLVSFITLSNWMWLSVYQGTRTCLRDHSIRLIGDLGKAAFSTGGTLISTCCSIVSRGRKANQSAIAMRPHAPSEVSRDDGQPMRTASGLLCQRGRHEFAPLEFVAIVGEPLIYWWPQTFVAEYKNATKMSSLAEVRVGLQTGDNSRFVRQVWEVAHGERAISSTDPHPWAAFVNGGEGRAWLEPLTQVVRWWRAGLEMREPGALSARPQNIEYYFRRGLAFTMIGSSFRARMHRYPSIIGNKGASVYPDDVENVLCVLNSTKARYVLESLNPGIGFEVGDVNRLPVGTVPRATEICRELERAFRSHESGREPSPEFARPCPSPWRAAQAWAASVADGGPFTTAVKLEVDELPPNANISFALGVALGRFSENGEGVIGRSVPAGLPHGILFLSDHTQEDSLVHPACVPLSKAWAENRAVLGEKLTLKEYLREKFFSDVHRKMYENRPIYFPLSSAKKSFVAYVSIHRWNAGTLNDLLAEHLYPAKKRLEGEQTDLRETRDGADKKAAKAAEKRFGEVGKWLVELSEFIALVEQCAEKGPPPPDGKTKAREADARYEPDLDDGVMINAAALWPLLEPQWKDPKKWWKELANAEGKKDYDWAHLAKRYFPERVDGKCKVDPSLAVAHGCFWKYHPAKAYQWELRLQDEIRPDFTLDEDGSDAARATFEEDCAEQVVLLVDKEHQRRLRKKAKAGQAEEDDAQRALDLEDDAAADDDEEIAS